LKTCTKCLETKEVSEFAVRNRNKKQRLQAHCKSCNKIYRSLNKEHERVYRKDYRKRTPILQKDKMLKYSYGITHKEYQDLVIQQENTCAICKNFCEVLVVDHDHSCCPGPKSCSKCIRGLLCRTCNLGLGYFKDNNKYLENALKYLKRNPDEDN
jgi:hypothetical protein